MKPKERCAYSIYGIQDEHCRENNCDGYPEACVEYTTVSHLEQFDNIFQQDPERTPLHPQVERFYAKWGRDYAPTRT